MGFGADAFAIASHLVLTGVLLVLAYWVLRLFPNQEVLTRAEAHGLSAAIAVALFGLAIERGYYVAARALKGQGIDLWSMHPAPEALSLLVAFGLFVIFGPLRAARLFDPRRAWGRLALLWCLLLLGWSLLAAVLV